MTLTLPTQDLCYQCRNRGGCGDPYCDGSIKGSWIYENEFGSVSMHERDLWDDAAHAYIFDFRVRDEYRRQGHGRELMLSVLHHAEKLQLHARLDVWSDNEPALLLYRSLGFEELSRSQGSPEAVITMHRL